MSERAYKFPIDLQPQPEGGYLVTSPVLPELITEGDTLEQALANAREVFDVVLEIYEDSGKPLPEGIVQEVTSGSIIHTEQLVPA